MTPASRKQKAFLFQLGLCVKRHCDSLVFNEHYTRDEIITKFGYGDKLIQDFDLDEVLNEAGVQFSIEKKPVYSFKNGGAQRVTKSIYVLKGLGN